MSDCAYSDLADDGLLLLEGEAIPAFLQGQLTCDTRQASATQTVPGAFCTAQGRVIADLRLLLPAAGTALLRLTADLQAPTAAVLGRYAMFSRIAVNPDEGAWQLGGLWGAGAAEAVRAACGSVPAAADEAVAGDDWLVVRCDGAGEDFECYFRGEGGEGARAALTAAAGVGDAAHWRARELARGLLRLPGGQAERHLPQALNYDLAGLVSFSKGCYTGQEVVARLHYRGRAKRRAALFRAAGDVGIAPGDRVVDEAGADRGEVLRSEVNSDGTQLLAALVPAGNDSPAFLGDAPLERLPWGYGAEGA